MTARLAASTFSFIRRAAALDSLRLLRSLGYERFDVLGVPGHLLPSEVDGPERAVLSEALIADDITIESINPQPTDLNLASPLADVRAYSTRGYADEIRMAVDLGAQAVVVVPGRVGIVPPPHADTPGRAAESIAVSVEVAYDVADAESISEDQGAAVRLLGPLIRQTHLSDARPGKRAHYPIRVGSVRFAALEERGSPPRRSSRSSRMTRSLLTRRPPRRSPSCSPRRTPARQAHLTHKSKEQK